MRYLLALCTSFCILSVSAQDYYLFAGTYTTGKSKGIYVYKFNSKNGEVQWVSNTDSSIQPLSQHIIHKGKSIDPQRQNKPHVHSVFFSPDEKFLVSPDLGLDQVSIYQFNANSREPLTPAPVPYIKSEPGAGPRHI